MSLLPPVSPDDQSINQSCTSGRQGTIEANVQNLKLGTTFGFRGFTLISTSFLIFTMFFLFFLSSELSLTTNLLHLGIPLVCLSLVIAHLLLKFVESSWGCKFFSMIWHGVPPIVYRNWLNLNPAERQPGITFGNRHLLFDAIDNLDLTIWGNLLVRTNRLCGPRKNAATSTRQNKKAHPPNTFETVLRIPFAVTTPHDQKLLIRVAKKYGPHIILNNRLEKATKTRELPGTRWISGLGVIFLFIVLIDNGYSDFRYLEILKQYYLAQTEARQAATKPEHLRNAEARLAQGNWLNDNPLPFSWISFQFLSKGSPAQGIYQAKSDALWELGHKQEAIACAKKALTFSPTSYRVNLKLARMLESISQDKEAKAQIAKAIENRKNSLLPRLYMIAIAVSHSPNDGIELYKLYENQLDETVFGQEPVWPPGGNRFLNELWYKDDLKFVFDRLLKPSAS